MRRGGTILVILVAVASLAWLGRVLLVEGGLERVQRLEGERARLSAELERTRTRNAHLQREIEALRKDPGAIRRAAREELGYLSPDEVVYSTGSSPGSGGP